MGTTACVFVEVTIENWGDVWDAKRGLITPQQVRRVAIGEVLIDTSAISLSLPTRLIRLLGLIRSDSWSPSKPGEARTDVYGTVRLTIQGRDMSIDALEISDDAPVVVGRIPLLHLDFVVDPKSQKLIGNPRHGGEHMFDMY